MSYKSRPKNKQAIAPFSGKKNSESNVITKITFKFTTKEGIEFKPPEGRMKITQDCGLQFLIKDEEGKWKNVKAKLNYLKIIYEKRKVLATKRKMPRKSTR